MTCFRIFLSLVTCFSPAPVFSWQEVDGIQVKDEAASTAREIRFDSDILPIFRDRCFSCHGPNAQESGYRLDIRESALAAGDYGDPSIVAGNSEASRLIAAVDGTSDYLEMPPDGERLSTEQIGKLRLWIEQGADWPDEFAGSPDAKLTTDHWSFQPVQDYPLPMIEGTWTTEFPIRNGIDSFIGNKLASEGLSPSEPADRVSLIRRVYLVMLGLQPTPEQVDAFINDGSEDAYPNLVDSVLASPHYGERWARHWLDVVRFGESTGYEVNRDRANAWYYRDYVINSLNNDKSYRDFIIEQLAGDAVGVDEATGFLVGGPNDIVKSPDINLTLMQRQDELADYVNTASTTFLGLTVACARCHDHKFDPVLQRDYYALQAVFSGVEHGERKLSSRLGGEIRSELRKLESEIAPLEKQISEWRKLAVKPPTPDPNALPMVNAALNSDVFPAVEARFVRFSIRNTNQSEPCIDELEIFLEGSEVNAALASRGSVATSSGDYQGNPIHQLAHINDGLFGNANSWICDRNTGWVQIEFPEPLRIDRVDWARDRQKAFVDRLAIEYSIAVSGDGENWRVVSGSDRRQPFTGNGAEPADAFIARLEGSDAVRARNVYQQITARRARIDELNKAIPVGYVGTFRAPEKVFRLYRGEPLAPREEVAPDVLTVMGSLGMTSDEPEQSRRIKLARWIASDDNPLTPRVIVNRVWHYHFGRGIVSTPSDLGKNGGVPSHPELLDWLAVRFMENGWSLKWLHRQILLSSTFQQSSYPRSEAIAADADCRLLWRFPPRRLEAEAIRDCVLQLTGKLNWRAGGPGFLLFRIDRENVHHYFPLEEFGPEHFRRMVYMTKIRQEQDEVFGTFDCPDGGQTIPQRSRSTTALQALNLLNSKFMMEQADYLAERLRIEAGDNATDQVRTAFDLAYSRLPSPEELIDAVEFIQAHSLEAFCRAMLNTNEFLFVS